MAINCRNENEALEVVPCWIAPCRSHKDRLLARVYFLVLVYQALGGDMDEIEELGQHGMFPYPQITPEVIEAGYVWLYRAWAEDLGAQIPDDDELAEILKCAPCSNAGADTEIGLLCMIFNLLSAGRFQ